MEMLKHIRSITQSPGSHISRVNYQLCSLLPWLLFQRVAAALQALWPIICWRDLVKCRLLTEETKEHAIKYTGMFSIKFIARAIIFYQGSFLYHSWSRMKSFPAPFLSLNSHPSSSWAVINIFMWMKCAHSILTFCTCVSGLLECILY